MSGMNVVGRENMRHDAVRQAYNRKALDGSPLKSPAGPVEPGPRTGGWRSMVNASFLLNRVLVLPLNIQSSIKMLPQILLMGEYLQNQWKSDPD